MLPMVDYCADMGQFEEDCSIPEYNMHHLELDQVTKVISYHPRFLDHFLRTQNFIMKGDGPLPYDYRYYLAIIAAARHQCPYLVKMYEKEFVNQGGNLEWLNGLDYIPSKLRAIYEINKILAHRPWLLRKEHIESLTKGKNSWSLSEVVHAMVLLSHFHSLSSFVFSCGLTQKLDGLSSPKLKTSPSNVTTTNKIATTTTTPINIAHNTITINNVSDSQQQHDNGGGGCGGGIEVAMISSPQHLLTYQQQHQSVPPATVTVAAAVAQQQQQQKTVLNEINLNQYNNTVSNSVSMTNSDNGVTTNNLIAPLNIVGNGGGGGNVNGAVHVIDNGAITINTANALNGVNKKNAPPSATVEVIMERMKVLSQNPNECSEAELSNRFKNVEMQTAELPAAPLEALVKMQHVISHYVEDSNFTYRDFARRGAENIPNTFRIQDYSWDDHGYSLVNGLYEDVGTLLDQKFRCAYNLTYFTMGGWKNVDTSKFRRAIWNYIHCIYGIRHDDYDYGEVNQLLDRPLKMFIKTACCFPDRITTKDYDSILVELQDSEKVHVNLMIMEARNQAELLYALREIMRYMT